VLDINAFLALLLKNSTDIRLTQLDVYTAADATLSAQAPFDPQLVFSFNALRNIQSESSQISGAETLNDLTQSSSVAYNQVLGSGPTISASFNALKTSSNSAFSFFNPSISTGLNISLTQPLLQNRGNLQLRAPLMIARTQLKIVSDQSLVSIGNTISNAAGQYWEAVRARDNIRVAEQSLDLAQKSYDRDKKALDLGALSRLDILQSESQVAQRKLDVIQAQYGYKQSLDGLRHLIGADLKPTTINIEIVLEDDPSAIPLAFQPLELNAAIAKAVHDRPELSVVKRRISIDDLNARVARNSLLPRLDLNVSAGSSGIGGDQLPVVLPLGGGTTTFVAGGLGDSLDQLFTFGSPYYGFGVTLQIPIKSSAAKASLSDSLVDRVRNRYSQRQVEQQIILDVKSANNQLELARASVDAAKISQEYARLNVDAEQEKYQLGTVTAFELLTAQSQLATAQSSVVNAYVNYQKAIVSYRQATWTILDDFGVLVESPKGR
jgi:outer membrane protein TolC